MATLGRSGKVGSGEGEVELEAPVEAADAEEEAVTELAEVGVEAVDPRGVGELDGVVVVGRSLEDGRESEVEEVRAEGAEEWRA